jgi:hypothetical protein
MKMLSIPLAAFALASSMALTTGAQAAQAGPAYTQISCMSPDGGPSGCWRVGRDYGPYSRSYGDEQTGRYAPSARDYRGFFDDRSPEKAVKGGAQYYGAGR